MVTSGSCERGHDRRVCQHISFKTTNAMKTNLRAGCLLNLGCMQHVLCLNVWSRKESARLVGWYNRGHTVHRPVQLLGGKRLCCHARSPSSVVVTRQECSDCRTMYAHTIIAELVAGMVCSKNFPGAR